MKTRYVELIVSLLNEKIKDLEEKLRKANSEIFSKDQKLLRLAAFEYQDDKQREEITGLHARIGILEEEIERLLKLIPLDDQLGDIWDKDNDGTSDPQGAAAAGLRTAPEATGGSGDERD